MSTETDLEDAIRRCDGSAVLEIMRRVRDEGPATTADTVCFDDEYEGRTESIPLSVEAVEVVRDIAGRQGFVWSERDVLAIRAYGDRRAAQARGLRREEVMRQVIEAWELHDEEEFEAWLYKQVKT